MDCQLFIQHPGWLILCLEILKMLNYFRFNTVNVLPCLLQHPKILLNEATVQGSTPVMVAIKYGNVDVMKILLKDERVDMSRKDGNG